MGDLNKFSLLLQLEDGVVSLVQAMKLAKLTEEAPEGSTHWHFNKCGCCVTLHGSDYAYVIGRGGNADFYAERGCDCDE